MCVYITAMNHKVLTVDEGMRLIHEKEKSLGIPLSDVLYNIVSLNKRLAQLEAIEKQRKVAEPLPAAPAPAAAAAAPKPSGPTTRAQHEQISRSVEPTGGGKAIRSDWSDSEVRAEAERILFSWHLRADFMRADSGLE